MTELALLASDPTSLDVAHDPVQSIVLACERAKTWLAYALDHDLGVDQIVEMKSQAEAIRVYTVQKQLGKDAELSAQEIVRRAERCIGVAIRRGQEAGEITRSVVETGGGPHRRSLNATTLSPSEILRTGTDRAGTYAVTDGVSDEQFDEALNAAKAEKNLSRANVVRKVRNQQQGSVPAVGRLEDIRELAGQGYSSSQIGSKLGVGEQYIRKIARDAGIEIHADKILGKQRKKIDHYRLVSSTVIDLEGTVMALEELDVTQIEDQSEIDYWVTSLSSSIRSLNRLLLKPLKEMTQ